LGPVRGEGDERILVVAGAGVAADLWMHGKIAGSPLEDGTGHVRSRRRSQCWRETSGLRLSRRSVR
jgi:hypothetical protein